MHLLSDINMFENFRNTLMVETYIGNTQGCSKTNPLPSPGVHHSHIVLPLTALTTSKPEKYRNDESSNEGLLKLSKKESDLEPVLAETATATRRQLQPSQVPMPPS